MLNCTIPKRPLPNEPGAIQPKPAGLKNAPTANNGTIPGQRSWREADYVRTPAVRTMARAHPPANVVISTVIM